VAQVCYKCECSNARYFRKVGHCPESRDFIGSCLFQLISLTTLSPVLLMPMSSLHFPDFVVLSFNFVQWVELATSLPSRSILLLYSVHLLILSFDILQWSRAGNRISIHEDKQTWIRSEVCIQIFKGPGTRLWITEVDDRQE
jgi:hypothetical protein